MVGDIALAVSPPNARIGGADIVLEYLEPEVQTFLRRFDPSDNPSDHFQPAGTPEVAPTTAYCGHCHRSIMGDWFGTPHQRSAQNPAVLDLFADAASSKTDSPSCLDAGGQWLDRLEPGSKTPQSDHHHGHVGRPGHAGQLVAARRYRLPRLGPAGPARPTTGLPTATSPI